MKPPKAFTRREKVRLAVSAAIVIALATVLLAQLPGPRPATSARRADDSEQRAGERAPWWSLDRRDRPSSERPVVNHLAPWESTAENTPDPGPAYIAAWRVSPPRPQVERAPPPPLEPPNPQLTRPSMFNTGGVNGSRPPRPVPGLDEAQ